MADQRDPMQEVMESLDRVRKSVEKVLDYLEIFRMAVSEEGREEPLSAKTSNGFSFGYRSTIEGIPLEKSFDEEPIFESRQERVRWWKGFIRGVLEAERQRQS